VEPGFAAQLPPTFIHSQLQQKRDHPSQNSHAICLLLLSARLQLGRAGDRAAGTEHKMVRKFIALVGKGNLSGKF
jgi:hypothetical protein